MTDRKTNWEERAAAGDYNAIPAPLGFAASVALAVSVIPRLPCGARS